MKDMDKVNFTKQNKKSIQMLLFILSERIAKFERLSFFPQTLVSPSILISIFAVAFFDAIDIVSNIDGSIFPNTLPLSMDLPIMKLAYVFQITCFKATISTHCALIEISFIFRAISKQQHSISVLLIILKASFINILIFNCKCTYAVMHKVFQLSFIYLLFLFIQGSHYSFYRPVFQHLAFEQKIKGFQGSFAFPFIMSPFAFIIMTSKPHMLAVSMPQLPQHLTMIDSPIRIDCLIEPLINSHNILRNRRALIIDLGVILKDSS